MIIAVDSATSRTGWALIRRAGTRDELLATGVLESVGWRAVDEFVRRSTAGPALEFAVIEDAYLGDNVATVKGLCRLIGRWQQAFEAAGVRTRLVMPGVWQAGLLSGLISGSSTRDARKAAAIRWVTATYQREVTPDEADAACMGTWFLRQQAMAALTGA